MSRSGSIIVQPYPGLIGIEPMFEAARMWLGPASGWGLYSQPLDEWKRQFDVVEVAALTDEICAALSFERPEQQVGPELTWARRLFAAAKLIVVHDHDRRALIELGVRVWTIGYHRNPGLLRIVGVGGGQPTLWIEQSAFSFYSPNPEYTALVPELAMRERPRGAPAGGHAHDFDLVEPILPAATGGVIDMASFMLAVAIHRRFGSDLDMPRDARARAAADRRRSIENMRTTLERDVDLDEDIADVLRADLHQSQYPRTWGLEDWDDMARIRHVHEPSVELVDAAELLIRGEPECVEVELGPNARGPRERGVGVYWRERVAARRLARLRPHFEGWLPDPTLLWGDATPEVEEGYLEVPASHRYLQP